MEKKGWIRLHQSFLDWEYYSNKNVKNVFLHLLLTAAYENTTIRGVELKPGEVLISERKLAKELGISKNIVRNVLFKLQKINEIKRVKIVNKIGQIFSINTFDKYLTIQSNAPLKISDKTKPQMEPVSTQETVPQKEPQMTPEKTSVINTVSSSFTNEIPQSTPEKAPVTIPKTAPQKEPLKKPSLKNNIHSGYATPSNSSESDVNEIIKNLSNSLRVQSDEKEGKKIVQNEKKKILIADVEMLPPALENRYHNAAVLFWKMLLPYYKDNYRFKNAVLEKWMADLKLIEKTHGYNLKKVFSLLKWAIENDSKSITYIQSPYFFAKEKSKNLVFLRKKKEYWEKNMRRRNGEIVTKISMPKNLIVADRRNRK